MRCPLRLLFASLLACAACSTAGPVPVSLAALLAEAPAGAPARLWLDGNRIVGAAVPVGPGELPADARRTAEAVQPRGELVFQGREWGPRGFGYRIDKHYAGEPGPEHSRSLLVTEDGRVLERSHSVPIPDVPQHVLATAMQVGNHVDEAHIVSGAEHEEHWSVQVHDRAGRLWAVEVTLDGRLVQSRRSMAARIEG